MNLQNIDGVEPTEAVKKAMLVTCTNKTGKSIVNRTYRFAKKINGKVRISKKGTPHILKQGSSGVVYSLCYFKGKNIWKVFWPWKAWELNKIQTVKVYQEKELLKLTIRILGTKVGGLGLHKEIVGIFGIEPIPTDNERIS